MMNEPKPRQGPRFAVAHLPDISPVPCPCGSTRRAFTNDPQQIASLHVVQVDQQAVTHYHRRMTELYYVLEGNGQLELDGQLFEVGPGSSALIKPGCRHRAVGQMTILNVPIPAFDPDDEFFD
jgi:quercetin dioxygenase-like cupin family protein